MLMMFVLLLVMEYIYIYIYNSITQLIQLSHISPSTHITHDAHPLFPTYNTHDTFVALSQSWHNNSIGYKDSVRVADAGCEDGMRDLCRTLIDEFKNDPLYVSSGSISSSIPEEAKFGRVRLYFRADMAQALDSVQSTNIELYSAVAVKIQSMERMRSRRWHYLLQQKSATRISSKARGHQIRCNFLLKKYRADRLRAFVLMKFKRRIFLEQKWAVGVIKSKLVGCEFFVVRTRYFNLRRLLFSVHEITRGSIIKRNTDYVFKMAVRLQIFARYYVFRLRLFRKRRKASVDIQRMTRGMTYRIKNKKLLLLMLFLKKKRIAVRVVARIQLLFRTRNTARRFQELRAATMLVQFWARHRLERIRYLKKKAVVLWVQSCARRMFSINRVSFLQATRLLSVERNKIREMRRKEMTLLKRGDFYSSTSGTGRVRGGGSAYKTANLLNDSVNQMSGHDESKADYRHSHNHNAVFTPHSNSEGTLQDLLFMSTPHPHETSFHLDQEQEQEHQLPAIGRYVYVCLSMSMSKFRLRSYSIAPTYVTCISYNH